MKINPDKCVACGNCTYVCPMGAIYIDPYYRDSDRIYVSYYKRDVFRDRRID